jgi:stage III sporulation protein AG
MTQLGDLWTRWLQKKADSSSSPETGSKEGGKVLLGNATGKGLAVLTLVGVALMMLSRGGGEPSQPTLGSTQLPATGLAVSLEERLAHELREILGHIEGVGEVQVYVTLEAGAEVVIAEEVSVQRTTGDQAHARVADDLHESRRPVTLRDDAARTEKPLIIVERKPTVRGVVVVARGASSPRVRYQLTQAVQTALSLPANRVAVFAMRSVNELRR